VLGQAPGAETVNRALALYRGRFLELEPANNSAIVRYREQLSGRVLGALKLQIDSCESRQEWESVLNYSTRALTLDDHDEDFHCAAIRAHLARGRRAEALRAFEHAKQRYAPLNLKPSPRLQALIADY
jgi:DNA-binding SARP family transcriptional activator